MIKLSLFATLLTALGLVLAACGGSDNPSASAAPGDSEYFANVARIFLTGQTTTGTANEALNTTLNAAQTLDEKKLAISDFLDTMIRVFDQSSTDMGALAPPDSAKDSHDQFKTDIDNARQRSSDLKDQLAGVSSSDQLDTIINDFNTEVDPIVTDSNEACKSLQSLSNSKGFDFDLSCGD